MTSRHLTVLVTGCSSGIGEALALAYHAAGHTVYATARREEKLEPLRAHGLNTLTLDVNDQMSIDVAVTRIEEEHGAVDILVNNAGFGAMGPMAEIPLGRLRRQLETNVVGPVALCQAVVPGMARQGSGVIVNIGSVSASLVTPFAGAYCGSKAALHAVSDALRMELAPFNIRVMTVAPGAISSQFGETAVSGISMQQKDESLYAPVQREVLARAGASQVDSTPAGVVARAICRASLRRAPPAMLRVGHGSYKLHWLSRWLPRRLRDRALMRRFGLLRLLQQRRATRS